MLLNATALLLSTVGYLAFLSRVAGIRVTVTPFVFVNLVVLLLYGFGLAGFLAAGAKVTLALGVLLGAFAFYRSTAPLSRFRGFNPAYLLLAIPFVLAYRAIPDDFLFLVWDELSFWAKSQRLIHDSGALLQADSPVGFKNYPPAQQLFQYYFTVWAGWSEKNVLFAQDVFVLSAILGAVGALVSRPLLAGLAMLTACTFIYFLHSDYATIYSDSLVAACFAGCAALALQPDRRDQSALPLVICLCGFVLVKEIALIFSAIVIVLVAINHACDPVVRVAGGARVRLREAIGAAIACAIPVAATVLTWRWYVSVIQAPPIDYGSPTLAAYMQGQLSARLATTLGAFSQAMFKPAYLEAGPLAGGFGVSLAAMILFLGIASGLVTALFATRDRLRSGLALLLLFGGMFAYLAFLLWTYLFYFTEYEGTRVASFDRYTMSYMLGWLIVVYGMSMGALERANTTRATLTATVILVVVALISPAKLHSDLRQIQIDQNVLAKRQKALELSEAVRRYIRPGEKVYFIAQNSNGYEKHMFDYSMIPYPPSECWSVGAKYHDGDVWTCNQPLAALLRGYAYLAIYNADDRFWRDNAGLLPSGTAGSASGVYRIVEEGGEVVRLEPVR